MAAMTLADPHWEALTPETRQAFEVAAGLPFIGRYYLAGGTGLALYLGHRFSVDLDFFSPEPQAVGPEVRVQMRQALAEPSLSVTFDQDGTFSATWRGVGISFFRLDLYPLVREPLLTDGVPLAAIEEIGAMKLAAIIGRGTRKDLVDLYFILRLVPLEKLFEVAAAKYARVRTFTISATRALAFFEDAERLPMPEMIDRTPWEEMKRFLERRALEAGRINLEGLWP